MNRCHKLVIIGKGGLVYLVDKKSNPLLINIWHKWVTPKYLCVCNEFAISAAVQHLRGILLPMNRVLTANRGYYEVNEAVFLVR